jgi:hypothetical protein
MAKQQLILNAFVDACDLDDGAQDRLISNVEVCRARSAAILSTLAFISSNDEGNSCLSAAQISTVRTIADDLVPPSTLACEVNRHQGYNILQGADFQVVSASVHQPRFSRRLRLLPTATCFPKETITLNTSSPKHGPEFTGVRLKQSERLPTQAGGDVRHRGRDEPRPLGLPGARQQADRAARPGR